MKILTKYMLKEFIKPLITIIFVFLLLFLLSEGFRIINADTKASGAMLFLPLYLLYQTPLWLTQIIPFACLLAFLFSFSNMSRHNEITAVKAGSININVLFIPIIVLSFIISISVILANEYIIPYTNQKSNFVYKVKIRDYTISTKTSYKNIVYIGGMGRKYIIEHYDVPTSTFKKINIDTFNKHIILTEQLYAETASWENDQWTFINGVYRTFDPKTNTVLDENLFQTLTLDDLPETPDDFKTEELSIDQMNIRDINKYASRLEKNSIPAYKERSQMHLKFAFPFASFIVILIGIAFASSKLKTNKIISFAISLVISFLYWGLTSVSVALGENRIIPPFFAAWITNFLFIIVSGYFIGFKIKR